MSGRRSTFGRATLLAVRSMVVVAAFCGVGALIVSAVKSPERVASPDSGDAKPASPSPAGQGAFVKLDQESQEKGGIETAVPQAATYQDQVRAYGTVLPLDRLTALYNQAITATAQLQAAKVKLSASKVANDRAKNLLKVFATAQAQAETAEANVKMDEANVASAQAQMDVLRNSAVQDWGAELGAAIVGRKPLVEQLVLRKKVLIQLSLQPGALAIPPRQITLSFGGMPRTEAELVSEATQVDPKIQTLGFWYVAPASAGLVAGTNILAYLPKGETKPGVGIPPSAVVWQAGKPWLFVSAGVDRFERRVIDDEAAPTADGGYVVPVTSLPADKRIVIAGAQTLLSEENKSQVPAEEDDN